MPEVKKSWWQYAVWISGWIHGFFGFSLCAFWGLSHGLPFPSEDK